MGKRTWRLRRSPEDGAGIMNLTPEEVVVTTSPKQGMVFRWNMDFIYVLVMVILFTVTNKTQNFI